jgi:hypothetical protein
MARHPPTIKKKTQKTTTPKPPKTPKIKIKIKINPKINPKIKPMSGGKGSRRKKKIIVSSEAQKKLQEIQKEEQDAKRKVIWDDHNKLLDKIAHAPTEAERSTILLNLAHNEQELLKKLAKKAKNCKTWEYFNHNHKTLDWVDLLEKEKAKRKEENEGIRINEYQHRQQYRDKGTETVGVTRSAWPESGLNRTNSTRDLL